MSRFLACSLAESAISDGAAPFGLAVRPDEPLSADAYLGAIPRIMDAPPTSGA